MVHNKDNKPSTQVFSLTGFKVKLYLFLRISQQILSIVALD